MSAPHVVISMDLQTIKYTFDVKGRDIPEVQCFLASEEVEQLDVQVDRNRDGGALESGDKRVDSRVP